MEVVLRQRSFVWSCVVSERWRIENCRVLRLVFFGVVVPKAAHTLHRRCACIVVVVVASRHIGDAGEGRAGVSKVLIDHHKGKAHCNTCSLNVQH